jgi:hypothetical protein
MARGEAVAAMKSVKASNTTSAWNCSKRSPGQSRLEELLDAAFQTYRASQPWSVTSELSPKSVRAPANERAMTFNDWHRLFYKLNRSEGSSCCATCRTRQGGAPDHPGRGQDRRVARPDRVASAARAPGRLESDEWEQLINPGRLDRGLHPVLPPTPKGVTTNIRAFRILVRNELP